MSGDGDSERERERVPPEAVAEVVSGLRAKARLWHDYWAGVGAPSLSRGDAREFGEAFANAADVIDGLAVELALLSRDRTAFRETLIAAGYRNVDALPGKSLDFARAVGRTVMLRTEAIQAALDSLIARLDLVASTRRDMRLPGEGAFRQEADLGRRLRSEAMGAWGDAPAPSVNEQ